MKKTLKIAAIIAAAALILAGCASGGKEKIKVRLSEVTHSVFYAPMYAAINLGFFEEEGLEIELTNAGGADKAMAALLSGSADIAFMGPEATVYVVVEGSSEAPVVVGQLTQRDGAFLVGRNQAPDFKWTDLKGAYIIGGRQGGVPEMTLEYALRKNNLDPKTDVTIDTSISFNNMGGAFTGGLGDYVTLFEPAATEVVGAGYGYVLASVGAEAGSVPYTCFQVTSAYLKKNGDVAERFLTAIYKGQKWVAANDDDTVAKALATSFPDTKQETLKAVVANYRAISAWSDDPIMSEDDYNRLLDIMEKAGQLQSKPDFGVVINNTLAEKVVKAG